MIGVAKAYTTRVGGGPVPSELDNGVGNRIRIAGNEFGTVTGRPRRCGWFDAVATRYSARISGVDTSSRRAAGCAQRFRQVCICEAYDINGRITCDLPSRCEDLAAARPVLRKVPGWKEDISGITEFSKLPPTAQQYCRPIEEIVGRPVEFVSVGPDRAQTIHMSPQ